MSEQKTNLALLNELRALKQDFEALKSTHDATIAEHKQVVAKLENKEAVLKKAEVIAKFGNWQAFLDEGRLKCSEGAARIYGLPSKEVTFENVKKLAIPSYRPLLDEAWNNLIVHGIPYNVEFKIKRESDGEIIDLHSVAEYDSVNRIGFGTINDSTDRKQAELKLIESEKKLIELNATKDKFFSIIAHDLKTPFNGILGFSEMLMKEVRNLDNDSIEKYTDIIHKTALQAYGLLENLLEWSKTQQNGLSFEPRKLLLRNVVSDEMAGLKLNADQKDISLVNDTDEEILLTADEKMLRAVVRNLISNALKFTPKGGLICVDAHLEQDNIKISVTDSGVGMNSDTLEKLFKIESSFSTRGTENERGTGLGLLLCKEFVEKHGGKIWGISEKGKGSTFIFTIPLLSTKKGSKL